MSVKIEAVVATADAMGRGHDDTVQEVLLEGVEESEHGLTSENELSDGCKHLLASGSDAPGQYCTGIESVLAIIDRSSIAVLFRVTFAGVSWSRAFYIRSDRVPPRRSNQEVVLASTWIVIDLHCDAVCGIFRIQRIRAKQGNIHCHKEDWLLSQ